MTSEGVDGAHGRIQKVGDFADSFPTAIGSCVGSVVYGYIELEV
jgi:hypothetical protein